MVVPLEKSITQDKAQYSNSTHNVIFQREFKAL